MTKYFVTTEGVGTAGLSWGDSIDMALWQSTTKDVVSAGDNVFFSHKSTENFFFDLDANDFSFPDTMSGTLLAPTIVECGQFGTQNGVSNLLYRKTWILGDNPYPWVFGDPEGSLGKFNVSVNHSKFIGFSIAHNKNGINIFGSITHIEIIDTRVFNCHQGLTIANTTSEDTKVINFRARDIRKTGIRVQDFVNNITVRDAKIDMGAIEGAAFANGMAFDDCSNLVVEDSYISNVIFMLDDNGNIQDSYIQGDGITADAGLKHRFRNVHVTRCGDRGLDSKATDVRIVGSSVSKCKFGYGIWSRSLDNKLIGCVVKDIAALRDEGSHVQVQGILKVIGCHLICGDRLNPPDQSDTGAVIRLNALSSVPAECTMIGGTITAPDHVAIVRFDVIGNTMTFKAVRINGVIFSGTRVFDGTNNFWRPTAVA